MFNRIVSADSSIVTAKVATGLIPNLGYILDRISQELSKSKVTSGTPYCCGKMNRVVLSVLPAVRANKQQMELSYIYLHPFT